MTKRHRWNDLGSNRVRHLHACTVCGVLRKKLHGRSGCTYSLRADGGMIRYRRHLHKVPPCPFVPKEREP